MGFLSQLLIQKQDAQIAPHAHLVGITGAGMKGLAEVLRSEGWQVSGSDAAPDPQTVSALQRFGIRVADGHSAEHVPPGADLLIHSPAIPPENPERATAAARQIPLLNYVEAISRVVNSRWGVAVAGTHGKSSTTALLTALFTACGTAPTSFCGASRISDGRNGQLGESELVVVEACEYRSHFLAFRPRVLCLLGIEHDHFDAFPDWEEYLDAYRRLIEQVPTSGTVVYNFDDPVARELVNSLRSEDSPLGLQPQFISCSLHDPAAHWHWIKTTGDWAGAVSAEQRVCLSGAVPNACVGEHQRTNLLMALATASVCLQQTRGVGVEQLLTSTAVRDWLSRPPQLKRRFEILTETDTRIVIDDFAHHPTEIAATLRAIRQRFPGRRVLCCFQPHQLSRTQRLRHEFAEALSLAEHVCLLPIFGAREQPSPDFQSELQRLSDSIVTRGCLVQMIPSLDQVWPTLETEARPGDVIATLGAGDLTRIHHECPRSI